MGNLSIRRLDDETIRRLRLRAAWNGRSMEEETRRIIKQAVATPERIGDLAVRLFGPAHGVDLELPELAGTTPTRARGAMILCARLRLGRGLALW